MEPKWETFGDEATFNEKKIIYTSPHANFMSVLDNLAKSLMIDKKYKKNGDLKSEKLTFQYTTTVCF